jgi:tryptophan-rich sensory protein
LFVSSVVICQMAGLIGSLYTVPAIPVWYAGLNKPPFNPPDWVFGPVWTALYLMMGVALYLLLRHWPEKPADKPALIAFAAQLILNAGWSVIFFGLRAPLAGFIWIIILWLAVLWTILAFRRVTKAGAILLIPYILWVSFAGLLNFFLWRLN